MCISIYIDDMLHMVACQYHMSAPDDESCAPQPGRAKISRFHPCPPCIMISCTCSSIRNVTSMQCSVWGAAAQCCCINLVPTCNKIS